MKLQNLIHILIGIVCIGLLPKAQAVIQPDGGYPGFNTAEGTRPFLASLPESGTQPLAGIRSLATRTAASTPLLAPGRSFSTSEIKPRSRG